MKILVVSSEVVPFAKTGGLADVAGTLPVELAALGHDVRVVMPKYAAVDDAKHHLVPILGDIFVRLGDDTYTAHVQRTHFGGTKVPVYFIQSGQFFERDGLYQEEGRDYPDNALRFAFFCKAVIWLLKGLDWTPDVIQCNDWQTALIPVYLRTQPDMVADEWLSQIKVLYTIHNLAYQGLFDLPDAAQIDIAPELLGLAGMEFYGKLNLMKGGLLFADAISTVSKTYSKEIQTQEFGAGLEGV
ncbi:MAG: glycogen/starch synthase, partial [Candidatus Sumerlaeaceae bacterium]|nr:glycogen/starch synthase [Candidatus Sumerlaeaceae bacterium]